MTKCFFQYLNPTSYLNCIEKVSEEERSGNRKINNPVVYRCQCHCRKKKGRDDEFLEFVDLIITDFRYGFLLLFYWLFSTSQFSEGNYNLVRWNFVQHEALCNKPLYDISIFHHTSKLISYSSEYGKSNLYLMQVK